MCTLFRLDLLKTQPNHVHVLTSALHRQDNTFTKKLTPLGRQHRLVTTLRMLRATSAEHRFALVPNLVYRIRVSLVQRNGRQHRLVITLRIRKAISTEHPSSYLSPVLFPESAFPLYSGTGNVGLRSQWTKVTSTLGIKWTCPV